MLSKLRQQSWYYAAVVTLAGAALGLVIFAVASLTRADGFVQGANLTPLSAAAGGLDILVGAVSGFLLDRLPKNKERSLRWLIKQPLIWQFVLFVFTAVVVLAITALLHANLKSTFVAALDIGLNLAYTVTSLFILYAFCRMVFYRKAQ